MTQGEYSIWYSIFIFIFSTIVCLLISQSRFINRSNLFTIPFLSPYVGLFLSVIAVFGITNCPADLGSDKYRYLEMFQYADSLDFSKDIAWQYFTYLSKNILINEWLYFLVIALFYIGCYNIFAKKYFGERYKSYFLVLAIGSMGFYAYGINTLRAGMALGFVLLAFCYRKNKLIYVLISLIAISFHKSMVLPLTLFYCLHFYKNVKTCIIVWMIMLIISFLNIGILSELIQSLFSDVDERVVSYMSATENDSYVKAGFRWDFIVYSVFPIFMGYYYVMKKNFKEEFYIQVLNTYILANAFWLVVIRIPYSDRFAYLSWFLAPFILIYPLTRAHIFVHQQKRMSQIIFIMVFVNFALNVLR